MSTTSPSTGTAAATTSNIRTWWNKLSTPNKAFFILFNAAAVATSLERISWAIVNWLIQVGYGMSIPQYQIVYTTTGAIAMVAVGVIVLREAVMLVIKKEDKVSVAVTAILGIMCLTAATFAMILWR